MNTRDWRLTFVLPRYGLFCFLAQLMASIFPSVPLRPNPPGTNTPLWEEGKRSHLINFIYLLSHLIICLLTGLWEKCMSGGEHAKHHTKAPGQALIQKVSHIQSKYLSTLLIKKAFQYNWLLLATNLLYFTRCIFLLLRYIIWQMFLILLGYIDFFFSC